MMDHYLAQLNVEATVKLINWQKLIVVQCCGMAGQATIQYTC